jgi:hypothetical protein
LGWRSVKGKVSEKSKSGWARNVPQFTPGFFVVRLIQGSPCSHRGASRFFRSFDHWSFDSTASKTFSENMSLDAEGSGGGLKEVFFSAPLRWSRAALLLLLCSRPSPGFVESGFEEWAVFGVVTEVGVKNPFNVICPGGFFLDSTFPRF